MGFAARSAGAVLLLALAAGCPGSAAAAPFTIGYTVTVTSLDPLFAGALNSLGVFVGGTIAGSYTLESTTPDLYPSQDDNASYEFAVLDAAIAVGGYGLTFDPSRFNYVNIHDKIPGGAGSDLYLATVPMLDSPQVGAPPLDLVLMLADSEGDAFSTDAITLVPPDLSQYETNFFILLEGGTGSPYVIGTITSLVLVPEPSSVLLLGAGIAAVIGLRRRRGA